MNIEKLHKVFDAYMDMFSVTYSKEHCEYVKWSAALHFQRTWNPDAEDFALMFKDAVSKTDMLINNRTVQPTAGILRLAQRPELQNIIRSMFKDLFMDDDGDLVFRQHRIEQFTLKANELLAEYEPGKWKYKQDFRTALAYLNLYRPEQNYLFKSSQAYQFKYCVEYGDDFGCGSQFSLEKYYRMCDEIRHEIKNYSGLTEKHKEYLEVCPEHIVDADLLHDDCRLLTFDIIYCTSVYQLYEKAGLTITKPVNKTSAQAKVIDKKEIVDQLNELIKEDEAKLCELYGQRSQWDDFSLVGLQVSHIIHGKGLVIAQDQMKITVRFALKEMTMLLPDAITNRNMKTDDPQIPEIMQEICRLDRQIDAVRCEVRSNKQKLDKMQKK